MPETATRIYARNLRRDPLGQLLAIATRHAGQGLPMSARAAMAEGCYLVEKGESPYHARRSFLQAILHRTGPNHPDYHAARELVRTLDELDSQHLGVAA